MHLYDAVDSWYIAGKYNMILNIIQKEEISNFIQTMNSQKAPHTSSFQAS